MNKEDLHVGAEVYWTDPDRGLCSGYRQVAGFAGDDIIDLVDEYGGETQAFLHELS
jgi:hypothetical protein